MAAVLPLLLQALPYVVKYGPDAVEGAVRIFNAIRSHPETGAAETAALDAAEADLRSAVARVADAPEVL